MHHLERIALKLMGTYCSVSDGLPVRPKHFVWDGAIGFRTNRFRYAGLSLVREHYSRPDEIPKHVLRMLPDEVVRQKDLDHVWLVARRPQSNWLAEVSGWSIHAHPPPPPGSWFNVSFVALHRLAYNVQLFDFTVQGDGKQAEQAMMLAILAAPLPDSLQ